MHPHKRPPPQPRNAASLLFAPIRFELIGDDAGIDLDASRIITLCLARALLAAQAHGVVHRDVKVGWSSERVFPFRAMGLSPLGVDPDASRRWPSAPVSASDTHCRTRARPPLADDHDRPRSPRTCS